MVTSLLSTLLDFRIAVALAFSMMVMAAISLVILAVGSRRANISIEANRLRGFKHDHFEVPVRAKSRTLRWLQLRILAIQTMEGLGSVSYDQEGAAIRLSLSPRYAGRFRGIRLTLEFGDPLRLMTRTTELAFENPTIDVLPLSLLTPTSRVSPRAASIGDAPAGSPGRGQELYSIDAYRGDSETRDILWKRVARSPGQELFVKVRESNVPETIRLSVIQAVDREKNGPEWVDLVCEGLGLLGSHLLAMGLTLKISFSSGGTVSTEEATAQDELVATMMNLSSSRPSKESVRRLVLDSDMVITGLKELEDPEIAQLVSRKPSLLILEDAEPILVGPQSVIFSGKENVAPLILRVVER